MLAFFENDALRLNRGVSCSAYSTPFWRSFGGVESSTVKCLHCSSTSTSYTMFHSLSMPLPTGQTHALQDIFRRYFESSALASDDCCEVCQALGQRQVITAVHRWPNCLVLHFKRWMIQRIPVFRQIINSCVVSFPPTLDVGDDLAPYALRGVVVHEAQEGSTELGHYTAYAKTTSDMWLSLIHI